MAANDTLGLNQVFQIYHEDGTEYEGLVMHKSATDSVVMSLGDSISGDVYWRNNELQLTMKEYITYNGVNYVLVNPPTIVREGMVADNSELKGMTKYSFKFYHPMYQLGNFPFSDVAVTNDQNKYLSENKTFSWIGTANDFLAKLNKNLQDTEWIVEMSSNFPNDKKTEMSDVIAFDKNTVADALKTAYDTWGVPYVIDVTTGNETGYTSTKHFKVVWGLPSNEIYESAAKKQLNEPYIFKMGKGVGLKNNSRTPRNNKIITRIAGYGSENNIPYGYPQIRWYGTAGQKFTYGNAAGTYTNVTIGGHTFAKIISYPIYKGILGGAYVELIKHPFTRTHLMPNVYANALFNKVSPYLSDGSVNTNYNPDIELKDYYDATAGEDYPNPINLNAPSYDIHEFDDIKPELGEERIVAVTPLNPDLTPASSWDDTMDDDGNYVQSYFQITLPTLSFDIYACAAITEAMEINMRSGACLGCTFPVEVDWEDYKANFYKENGDFDPVIHTVDGDGHVRNGKKYPDSSNSSTPVKLILKKENATFGTLMPNIYQQPHGSSETGYEGDKFVVLGISLPTSYITNAQTRLDNAMKSYMLENNVYYYDYPLKFDEAFLRKNTYILQQIKPNSIIRFKFAGENLSLYVKQMNVKFGEGVLPKYDITLTDNVDVVLNQIGKVSDDVDKLATLISLLRQSYGNNVWAELSKKLSKTDDDTAQGLIRFVKGLQVGERFVTGLLGEGGVFNKDADGKTYIEADKLYIRMKAYFDTVEIRKYMHSAGNRIASLAGIKCVRVDNMAWYAAENKYVPVDNSGTYRKKDINGDKYVVATGLSIVRYRCYFRGNDDDGNNITNDFVIGDQAYCHVTNGATASLQNHHYWRLVVGKDSQLTEDGEHWIDLSNVLSFTIGGVAYSGRQDGSDKPAAQDDIVQLGNVNDPTRRGAIIEYVSGNDAPSYQIYQDIGTPAGQSQYSLANKNYIGIGYKSTTGRAYMNVYGDFLFGDKAESTYIKYNAGTKKLEIKAVIEASSTIGGTQTPTTIGDILSDIDDLQSQIDGAIETWFENYMPVSSIESTVPLLWLDNEQTIPCLPYKDWYDADTTAGNNNVRLRHLGDVFYDNTSGYAFRFSNTGSSASPTFSWVQITDSAVIEALRKAAEAYNLADTKNKVFTTAANTLPPVPYKTGDLWANATGTFTYIEDGQQKSVTYSNDILKCVQSRDENASGSRSITDWVLASKYTDDTVVEHYMDILTGGSSPTTLEKEAALAAERAIRSALGGKTIIDGGLMLTSILALRKLNHPEDDPDDPDNYTTYAGISGVYDTNLYGGGIAAWYGGGMVDKRNATTGVYDVVSGAKSGFRFDGSGWLADGNITWDAQGRVAIKDITTLVGGNNTDILNALTTFNNAFHFTTSPTQPSTILNINPQYAFSHLEIYDVNGNHAVATTDYVNENFVTKAFFNRLFQAYSNEDHTDAHKVNPNEATAINNLKILVGAWTDQYLSAKGINPQQSGGGGVGDVTWDLLASNSDTHQIAASHLNVLSGYATQSWVTSQISGKVSRVDVGTTQYSPNGGVVSLPAYPTKSSWNYDDRYYISGGVIHLGSNTITPLTSFTETDPTVPSWAKASKKPSYTWDEITSKPTTFTPPTASSSVLGGVKIGTTMEISSGVINQKSGIVTAATYKSVTVDTYGRVTAGTNPTTLAGYGITDAVKGSTTWWGRPIVAGTGNNPDTVSGDLSSVGNISFSSSGKNIGGLMYFDTANGRIGVGTSAPETNFDVVTDTKGMYIKNGDGKIRIRPDSKDNLTLGFYDYYRNEWYQALGFFASGTTNTFIIGTNKAQTRTDILGSSVRLYSVKDDGNIIRTLGTTGDGHVIVGYDDGYRADSLLNVNGDTYTDRLYLYRPTYNSDTNALYLEEAGTNALSVKKDDYYLKFVPYSSSTNKWAFIYAVSPTFGHVTFADTNMDYVDGYTLSYMDFAHYPAEHLTRIYGKNVSLYYKSGNNNTEKVVLTTTGARHVVIFNPSYETTPGGTNSQKNDCVLTVNGDTYTEKLYLYKPNAANDENAIFFTVDTITVGNEQKKVLKLNGDFYATGFVSALGASSGGSSGGGVDLHDPLSSIHSQLSSNPIQNNSILIYSSSLGWHYDTFNKSSYLTSTYSLTVNCDSTEALVYTPSSQAKTLTLKGSNGISLSASNGTITISGSTPTYKTFYIKSLNTKSASSSVSVINYTPSDSDNKTLTFKALGDITLDTETSNQIGIKYKLPTASSSTKGGVKVGSGLSISNGILRIGSNVALLDSSQTFTAVHRFDDDTWYLNGAEHCDIHNRQWDNGTLYNNDGTSKNASYAIRNAVEFRWYNTYWDIGNIRSSDTSSYGFGIAYRNESDSFVRDCLRVTPTGDLFITGNEYVFGTQPAVHVGTDNNNFIALHWSSGGYRGLYGGGWVIGYNGSNTFLSNGNVGIGTESPSQKLEVNGNVKATRFYLTDQLYFEVDGTSIKCNGDFYATGAVSALGSNSQSGGGGAGDVTWDLLATQATNERYIHQSYIQDAVNSLGYATQSWVTLQGYLTSSALSSYVTTNTTQDITAKKTFTVQQAFTVASGSPFTVTSSTVVTNLNADKLDGQHGSYYATATGLSTLQGYFTNGVANSSAKLSDATEKTAWGQTFFTGGTPTSISNAPLSGVTNIDSLLHFDTTNNYVGIGASSPSSALDVNGKLTINNENGYAIEAYGQLRFNASTDSTNHPQRVMLGCFTETYQPFIRFKGSDGTVREVLNYNQSNELILGDNTKATYVRGANTNIYSKATDSTSLVMAIKCYSGGRVGIGDITTSYISTVPSSYTGSKLIVRGDEYVDGSLAIGSKIYLYRDSSNSSNDIYFEKVTENGVNFVKLNGNFYATGSVSALGAGTGGGGSTVDFSAIVNSLNQSPTAVGTGFLYSNGGAWSFKPTSLFWKTTDFDLKTALSVFGDYDNHGATNLGWIGDVEDDAKVVTSSMLAYWDGCYSGTSSNLTFCVKGAFGDIVTKNLSSNIAFTGNIGIGASANSSYKLYVNGSSCFNGNVGIGTTSSVVKLNVDGVAQATELRLSHGFYIDWDNSNTNAYTIGEEDSDIYAAGDWYGRWASSSDVRLKDIDKYLDGKLEDIALAPIFSFRWKNKPNKPLELGTSAQYWKIHLSYGVTQTHSGYLALDYGATALASAVFTARKVLEHEGRIRLLEIENQALRKEIEQLKKTT